MDSELIARVTAIVRRIDPEFEKEGGSTRHWVRDFFLPALATDGLEILTDQQVERYRKALEQIATEGTITDSEIAAKALGYEDREHFDRRDLGGS